MRFSRQTRTAIRSMGHLLLVVVGGSAIGACAELEVGAQAYKSLNRAATEPTASDQPGLPAKPKRIVIENPDAQIHGDLDPNYRSAPEVFFATGVAKWDGARTLRGIWVAHPLARKARRVRIVNRETRQAVDGALFKRDTTLAGPSLLVSSDAAQALGLTPGEATALEIYALERAETSPGSAPAETVAAETGRSVQDGDDAGEETVTEIATYATERAEGQQQPEEETGARTPFGKTAARTTADGGAVVTAERLPVPGSAEGAPSGSAEETSGRTAEGGQSPAPVAETGTAARPATAPAEPDEETLARITAAVEAPQTIPPVEEARSPASSEAEPPEAEARPEPAATEPRPTVSESPAPASDSAVEETPARIAAASSGAAATRPEPSTEPQAVVRSPSTQSAQSAQSGTATATTRPAKPYIQLGVFGVPENATRLIERLRKAGLPSLTKTLLRDDGSTLIRVMAGPFEDPAAQQRAFETIKKFGIKDAIAVRG